MTLLMGMLTFAVALLQAFVLAAVVMLGFGLGAMLLTPFWGLDRATRPAQAV